MAATATRPALAYFVETSTPRATPSAAPGRSSRSPSDRDRPARLQYALGETVDAMIRR